MRRGLRGVHQLTKLVGSFFGKNDQARKQMKMFAAGFEPTAPGFNPTSAFAAADLAFMVWPAFVVWTVPSP